MLSVGFAAFVFSEAVEGASGSCAGYVSAKGVYFAPRVGDSVFEGYQFGRRKACGFVGFEEDAAVAIVLKNNHLWNRMLGKCPEKYVFFWNTFRLTG